MNKIGFIGVGVMGRGMVRNLLKHGFEVTVYTRTRASAAPVIEAGAHWADTIAGCVGTADAVITMVGYPKDVEEVYFSQQGVLASAKKGAYLIDMTTTRPDLAAAIYGKAAAAGLCAMDAPVSGGDAGAQNGTLSIMAGGDADDFAACMPIFEAMGTAINLQGPAGSGQRTKMANQIAICGALAGVCEAIVYARGVGLDPALMLASISKGVAGSRQMEVQSGKILAEDYAPGFYIKHFVKDMQIAKQSAAACGMRLPVLDLVLDMFETLERRGDGDLGTQALIKYYYFGTPI